MYAMSWLNVQNYNKYVNNDIFTYTIIQIRFKLI